MAKLQAEIERLQTWNEKLAAERLQDRAEIERLRVALQELEHITSHEIRRWDIANEIARAALEPKPLTREPQQTEAVERCPDCGLVEPLLYPCFASECPLRARAAPEPSVMIKKTELDQLRAEIERLQ